MRQSPRSLQPTSGTAIAESPHLPGLGLGVRCWPHRLGRDLSKSQISNLLGQNRRGGEGRAWGNDSVRQFAKEKPKVYKPSLTIAQGGDFCWWGHSRVTTGEDGDGQNRCWCWSRSAETCHCLKAAQSCILWKDTLKEGWFPWSGAAAGSQSTREGCCVVLTHPAWLWGRVLGLVPSPAPTMCPFSLSSNQGQTMWEAGEASSCNSKQQTQALGAQHTLLCARLPKTPQQIPRLAIMIHFSRMKSVQSRAPAKAQWHLGGSLQPSQAPWVIMQPVLEPWLSPFPPHSPSLQQLPVGRCEPSCHRASPSEGLSLHPSPEGGPLPPNAN